MTTRFQKRIEFNYPADIPFWIAKEICKEAKRIINKNVNYRVSELEDEKGKFCQCVLNDEDNQSAQQMQNTILTWLDTYNIEMFNINIHSVNFFAEKIIEENTDVDVLYYTYTTGKYETMLLAIGNDRNEFIETIKEEQERFIFSSAPLVLCLILIGKMATKINKNDLKLIPNGKDTLVHPSGPFAEKFYEEFSSLYKIFYTETIEERDLDDSTLDQICKSLSVRSAYWIVKRGKIILKGIYEDVKPVSDAIRKKIASFRQLKPELEEEEIAVEDVNESFLVEEEGPL